MDGLLAVICFSFLFLRQVDLLVVYSSSQYGLFDLACHKAKVKNK